jgi:hypothetical protein
VSRFFIIHLNIDIKIKDKTTNILRRIITNKARQQKLDREKKRTDVKSFVAFRDGQTGRPARPGPGPVKPGQKSGRAC